MLATNIDEVVTQMDKILEDTIQRRCRAGYFAALYRQVTLEVRRGIHEGYFEDGPRMDQLDTVFANRYLLAYDQWRAGLRPSRSWQMAFDGVEDTHLSILQHLLLGMNAHINLDLGLAAAQVCPGKELRRLYTDFNRINDILGRMIDQVEGALDQFSPLMDILDRLGGPCDEAMLNFSIKVAREEAWQVAELANGMSQARYERYVTSLDRRVADLGERIARPRPPLDMAIRLIQHQESTELVTIIQTLNGLVPADQKAC